MRIKRFSYQNKATGWKLEPVEFNDFNLLVGASGVGKTQILRAIKALKNIIIGKTPSGVVWDVDFEIKGVPYNWSGEYENIGVISDFGPSQPTNGDNPQKKHPKIIYEKLFIVNQTPIFERQQSTTTVRGKKVPFKINSFESGLKLLDDDDIAFIREHFHKIAVLDTFAEIVTQVLTIGIGFTELKQTHHTLKDIQNNNRLGTYLKLALLFEQTPDIFDEIKEVFISIFPSVKDIKFAPLEQEGVSFFIAGFSYLYIKEQSVSEWIFFDQISQGMLKILLLIACLYVWTEETVLLIDEFENSLGVNCIDIVEDLMTTRNLQLIITSHHPYIINNIPMDEWKIVTREKGTVTVRDAIEFRRLGRSSHERFLQLIQLDEIRHGVTS